VIGMSLLGRLTSQSIRARLAGAFLVVLLLFAMNLAVHFWAGHRRQASLNQLRASTERSALTATLAGEFEDRAREFAVAGQVPLTEVQMDGLLARVDRLVELTRSLELSTEGVDRPQAQRFLAAAQPVLETWRREYQRMRNGHLRIEGPPASAAPGQGGGAGPTTRPEPIPPATVDLDEALLPALERLRRSEERGADRAAADLQRVSALTDQVALGTFVGSILAALLVSTWLWRSIAVSLRRLREGTARLAAGDTYYRIALPRQDELGQLAGAFNSMAGSVETALDEARAAREIAERANRAKSSFLANMTHEFRTPMTAILGYAELLREEADERGLEAMALDAAQIERSGRHMLALVNDLLDLARIESGRMLLTIEEFEIGGLVDQVTAALQPVVEEHGNRLMVHLPTPPGTMVADPVKVRQMLFNLLGNAAKFTDNGQITLRVERRAALAGERIAFEVTDTGIGIERDRLDRIFEEYEQGNVAVARKYGGTGLGLAIVRRYCRMMGGEITVESEVGAGSRFTVVVPALVTPAPEQVAHTA
jgi:signal transduction histidine kinase